MVTDIDQLTVVTARADGDIRHPVVRTGEREPIPGWVRSAVWWRDHGRCELCGDLAGSPWELDHIIPWSAGGSDDTTNLRVLCQRHNQERSNLRDPFERKRMPATWWCIRCYASTLEGAWWAYEPLMLGCPTHATWSGGNCNVADLYRRMWKSTGEFLNWHQRDPIELDQANTVAFCAHCRAPGYTDRPL